MKAKILALIGSIRFWIVTFAWLAGYLANVEQDGFSASGLFDQIGLWLATVATIGTVEKIVSLRSASPKV